MDMIRNRMITFTEMLKTKVDGIDIIQAGSSFDELHMTRVLDKPETQRKFFPDIDFDFDLVYTGYIVDDEISTDNKTHVHKDDTTKTEYESNGPTLSSDAMVGHDGTETSTDIADRIISPTEGPTSCGINVINKSLADSTNIEQRDIPKTKGNANGVTPFISSSGFAMTEQLQQDKFGKMIPTDQPGYVKLFVTETGRNMLQKPGCRIGYFVNQDGYLLNTAFSSDIITKQDIEKADEVIYSRTNQEYVLSGPAITDVHLEGKGFTYDFVHAFPCNTWPSCAKGWMDRARSCHWPNEKVIDRISKGKFIALDI